jgi:uncharacterized protein YecT (DUF1311 family)
MRIVAAAAAIATVFLATAPVRAQSAPADDVSVAAPSLEIEARYSKGYKTCPGFDTGGDMQMLECVGAEVEIQDKRLNETYKKALDGLTAGQKEKLRNAERAWVIYRDAWCDAQEDDMAWGSLSKLAASQCVLDQTIQRTIDLENYPPST